MFTDDTVNYGKAETSPFARLLSGKIGFKDTAPDIGLHANPRIRDADGCILFCSDGGKTWAQHGAQGRSRLQKNLTAVRHRVPRVHAEIEYGLTHETSIDHVTAVELSRTTAWLRSNSEQIEENL